jgi:hypothetical protein
MYFFFVANYYLLFSFRLTRIFLQVSRAVNEAVANAVGSMASQFGVLAERAETNALAHVQAQLTSLQVHGALELSLC